jgi:hypothetical protein
VRVQRQFDVPTGYTPADGRSTRVGPLEVGPGRDPNNLAYGPIRLVDGEGNGTLDVTAVSFDSSSSISVVPGLTGRVRRIGSDAVLSPAPLPCGSRWALLALALLAAPPRPVGAG